MKFYLACSLKAHVIPDPDGHACLHIYIYMCVDVDVDTDNMQVLSVQLSVNCI